MAKLKATIGDYWEAQIAFAEKQKKKKAQIEAIKKQRKNAKAKT